MAGAIRWTKTKRHDEFGVVIFGPVAVPVSILIVLFLFAQVVFWVIAGLGVGLWGWNEWVWITYGILWGAAFAALTLYGLWEAGRWFWVTLRDANSWQKAEKG